jgi:16S rRNA processing protein RimM
VLVGIVARTHGLRGQVMVNPHTDFVEERYRPGAVLWTRRNGTVERVIVASVRFQQSRPVVAFDGVVSVEQAGSYTGCELRVPEAALHALDRNAHYLHQLIGCEVETIAGARVGRVSGVSGGAGASVLAIAGQDGEVLVPFAADICVSIDVATRRIVIAPPEGLLDLNVTGRSKRGA